MWSNWLNIWRCEMYKVCIKCGKKFDLKEKKCLDCGGKLKKEYSEEELKELQKQNDDFTVINTTIINMM